MEPLLTADLGKFIRPEAVELLTLEELSYLKEWLYIFRESNLTKTCENMLCIPPKSKELEAAIKRVASKLVENKNRPNMC